MNKREFNPALETRRTALSWDKNFKGRLDDIRGSLEAKLSNRELFLLCLAYGWKAGELPGIPPRATDSARIDALQPNDWVIFNTVAMVHSQSYEVLSSKDAVLDIVENYAAGGLKLLSQQVDAVGSLRHFIAQETWPLAKAWKTDDGVMD